MVVLASGTGSLLRALLEAAAAPDYPARIVAVGVDRACAAAEHAEAAGMPHFRVAMRDMRIVRHGTEIALTERSPRRARSRGLAGFMKLLGPQFLDRFGGRIINTHPALLPAFPGAHGVRDALAYGVKVTGSTVHLVDAGVDTGPILAQEAVAVHARRTTRPPCTNASKLWSDGCWRRLSRAVATRRNCLRWTKGSYPETFSSE